MTQPIAASVSTVPTVKANLVDLLKAMDELTNVTVDYGDPGLGKVEREHVWLGGSPNNTTAYAPYGQAKQEEEYAIQMYVHVTSAGMTQQEATERVFALYSAIAVNLRPLLRTSTRLAPGVWTFTVTWNSFVEYVLAEGHATLLDAQIEIKARI